MTLCTVTAYGRSAGSARVRVFDWLDHLGLKAYSSTYLGTPRNSLATVARSPLAVLRAERDLRCFVRVAKDAPLLLSRQASPFSNGGLESRLLAAASRGVYDFDDALMYSPWGVRERVWSKRRAWSAAVRSADVVIAGNEYLAERAADLNRNIVIVPSCVEVDAYPRKADYAIGDLPRAVWVGSPGTEQYLITISIPLLALHKSHGLRISLVSAGNASLGLLDRMVDRFEWSPEVAAHQMLRADVGIMPLDDSRWSRGKCAYKLLQYAAVGLPLIGSPVGANATVLGLADALQPVTSDDWHDAIELVLKESEVRRAQRGRLARQAVEARYTFDVWSEAWVSALGLPSANRGDAGR